MVFLSVPNVLELSWLPLNASINLSAGLTLWYITPGWIDNGSETLLRKISGSIRMNIFHTPINFCHCRQEKCETITSVDGSSFLSRHWFQPVNISLLCCSCIIINTKMCSSKLWSVDSLASVSQWRLIELDLVTLLQTWLLKPSLASGRPW